MSSETFQTADHRAEIMAAAAHEFATHGYHAVSMRDLARRLGRAPATFYSHFASKEDLLFALQKAAFDELLESVRAALHGVTEPAERLRALVLHHLEFVGAHGDVMQVLLRETSALPRARREAIRARREKYIAVARDVLRGVTGAAGDVDAERATWLLFGMLNSSYAWHEPAAQGAPAHLAAAIAETLLHGLPRAATRGTKRGPRALQGARAAAARTAARRRHSPQ